MNPQIITTAAKSKTIKNIVMVLLVIILLIVVFLFIKKFLKKDEIKDDLNDVKKDLDKSKLTYPKSQYSEWASRLFQAMKGAATDEETIYNIIDKLKNKNDWRMLVVEFGIRESGYWATGIFKGDLNKWLEDELDDDEKQILQQKLNAIGVYTY